MKHVLNIRAAVAPGLVAALFVAVAPSPAVAGTTVGANWTQKSVQGPSARAGTSLSYDSARQKTVLFGGATANTNTYLSDTWQYDGAVWTQLPVPGPPPRYLGPMVFDALRGVTVLFGGYSYFGWLNDLWEWDGSTWTRRFTAHMPPIRNWSAMTYDSKRHVVVLFGGTGTAGLLNDTWEYNGADWAQVATAHAPSPRRGHGLAFDSVRGKTVVFGGQADVNLNDTWEYDGIDWTQIAVQSPPVARLWPSMTFDPALGGVALFGGSFDANTPMDDTWLYDGAAWQQLTPTNQPSARFWASAVYDSADSQLVLFGGAPNAGPSNVLADTWALPGVNALPSNWAQATTGSAPAAREFAAMDYDSSRGVTVLFGGDTGGPVSFQDTWEWDGFTWSQMAPQNSPRGLAGAAMAYDSRRGVSVLFGGSTGTGLSSSTWEWDGRNWTQRLLSSGPPARVFAAMVYDTARGRIVMFGGSGQAGQLGDTWEFDGSAWTQLSPASSPTSRFGPALAFDSTRHRIVLFGGEGSSGRLADTWEWDGSNWAQASTATAPYARFWSSMAFDSERGKTVLFGGDHIQPYALGPVNDTWEWDGTQWTRDWTAAAPPMRAGHTMAYDSGRGRMVLFGGDNASMSPVTLFNDTWELGSGTVTAPGNPNASLSKSTIEFGNVKVGSTSFVDAVMLTSSGTGPLTISSESTSGAFSISSTDCPVSPNPLASGSYCLTLVTFSPTVAGDQIGTLTFSDNAPGGSQTVALHGTGTVVPTALTVSAAVAVYNGTTSLAATLTANGSPLGGQPVAFTLPNGSSLTVQTDAQGVAVWAGASVAGIHAGTYSAGIQVTCAGAQAYGASSGSGALTVTQPVAMTYTGDFFLSDSSGGGVAIRVDQGTAVSDRQFIDYSSTAVWAHFTVVGPASTSDFYAQVTDAPEWSTSGLGIAASPIPPLPDGAYTVIATLVDGAGSSTLSATVAGDDVRIGLVSSPTKAGYVSGGGGIAADPYANTADTHGYFSFQMKPSSTIQGNLVYVFRVQMDVGGGTLRDVDVWVTSSDVTSLSGNSSSTTAGGHFSVAYVDAQTGQRYSAFEFAGGTFKLTAANSTNKSQAGFALVLKRADGTLFHASGSVNSGGSAALAPVVLGSIVCHL